MEIEMEQVSQFLKKKGADLVGFCNCREYFPEYSSAVIVGVSVLRLFRKSQSDTVQVMNETMDLLNVHGRQFLYEKGYGAWGALFSQEDMPGRNVVPHRELAVKAGLGIIGKNFLVITPEFGPRVQFSTILTTMPVLPGPPLEFDPCATCSVCVDMCPTGALGAWFRHEKCIKCYTCVLSCPVGKDVHEFCSIPDLSEIWRTVR
ncbi:MAG: epoxyqueuosine reductase [Theionarchaea archaeon]|nr:epoxyqueuosine reductase [Theionarchaea archaeon]MBU6999814.1 epoxyqueuosine reductase [Theionarchaea archaeon]MBU7020234.1 epoxyqueuosine reductase [Theionarchaea archaeon]MBU7033647.1 epoxyqueuosine reductase [Theionarchaea archaeon]MBU7040086.1 epoxyqueuosine reductase [Theionarchaea archaeon]